MAAMATYVITNNPRSLIGREPWSIPEDNPNGEYLCFDRLVSAFKDKSKAVSIGRTLIKKAREAFPNKNIIFFSVPLNCNSNILFMFEFSLIIFTV